MKIDNAFLSIGNNDLISDINWTIMLKDCWALVGKNGCGKSTLLKALTDTVKWFSYFLVFFIFFYFFFDIFIDCLFFVLNALVIKLQFIYMILISILILLLKASFSSLC